MLKYILNLKKLTFIFCFSFLLCNSQSRNEHYIKGQIQLDSTWSSKIYLSLIPSFDKMSTMSNAMIVSSTDIDKNGHFKFDISFLPEEEQLYRIHIAKKEAPPASLIIGGDDENHIFIFANSNSTMSIVKESVNIPFKNSIITGSSSSIAIRKIDGIEGFIDSTYIEDTYLKREFISKGVNEKLRFVADTSTNALVSLYALYKSKYESNYNINKQFYIDYLEKWKTNKSSYFKVFRKTLPIATQKKSYTNVIIGILCFIIGALFSYYFVVIKKSKKLQSLSVQERKIFSAIKDGKSNKEISEEYNIGINTVKSHIKNIYSKLGLKSRKQAMDFK